MSRPVVFCRALVLVLATGGAAAAWAQAQAPRYIFQCTTVQGRTLTSDRLIGECNDREQRVFSSSGVLIRVVPPSLTADERAVLDAKHDRERVLQEAQAENVRRDRQLSLRFANEKAHARAREQALDHVVLARKSIEKRLEILAEERVPLQREAEFYEGKSLPVKLKLQFDALEATETGLQTALEAQGEEYTRINELYDIELERLKRLWAGAAPGSLGPLRAPSAVSARATKPTSPATTAPAPAVTPAAPSSSANPRPADKPKGGGGTGDSSGSSLQTVSRTATATPAR